MLHATKANLTNSIYDSSRKKVMMQLGIGQWTCVIQALTNHRLYTNWNKDYNKVIRHQILHIQNLVF